MSNNFKFNNLLGIINNKTKLLINFKIGFKNKQEKLKKSKKLN